MQAYEGIETLDSFGSDKEIEEYRQAKLTASEQQEWFLRQFDLNHVYEIGCGNGRIAIALAPQCQSYHGIDVSRSRIEFAERWAKDLGFGHIGFQVADAFEYSPSGPPATLSLCITGAFGYFDCIKPDGAKEVLERIVDATETGGVVVLETYAHPKEIRLCEAIEGPLQMWSELAPSDPWRFYLSRYDWDPDGRFFKHMKTFIGRNGAIDEGRIETLRVYGVEELHQMLRAAGCVEVRSFDGWSESPANESSPVVVTIAKKAS